MWMLSVAGREQRDPIKKKKSQPYTYIAEAGNTKFWLSLTQDLQDVMILLQDQKHFPVFNLPVEKLRNIHSSPTRNLFIFTCWVADIACRFFK